MKLLEGKTAIITGASRGIGKAVALEFARQGANIAFTDLRYDEIAQETEKEIAALGVKAKMYASNAADFAATNATVDEIVKEFGRVDIPVSYTHLSFFRTGSGLEVRFRGEAEHSGNDVFGE